MKAINITSIFLLLIFTTTCKKENISIEKEYTLNHGYTVTFNQDALQIHFDEVLEDSRCPPYALCAWEGRAVVKMIVIENDIESDYEFSTFAPIHMDTTLVTGFGDYRLELKAVNPYPTSFPMTAEDYNIEFRLIEL